MRAGLEAEPQATDRINARFRDTSDLRDFLNSKVKLFLEVHGMLAGKGNEVSFYRSLIEFTNIGVYGREAKPIDWDKPIGFTDKDLELIAGLENAGNSISQSQLKLAAERLAALPKPLGSKADKGELDDYNPEVLLTVHFARELALRSLDSIQKFHWFQRRSKVVGRLASNIGHIADSLKRSSYDEAFKTLPRLV